MSSSSTFRGSSICRLNRVVAFILTMLAGTAASGSDTAISLDGSLAFVGIGNVDNFPLADGDFSISAVVKPDDAGDYQIYFERRGSNAGGSLSLYLKSNKAIVLESRSSGSFLAQTDTNAYTPGVWNFINVTVEDLTTVRRVRFYVNGTQVKQVDVTEEVNIANQSVSIGARNRSNKIDRRFKGLIDEVRLHNRALSTSDVQNYYNSGQGDFGSALESDLIAGWHFDDGVGETATDYSGNGFDGLLFYGVVWASSNVALDPASPPDGFELAITPGTLQIEPATPFALNFVWPVSDDDNRNATVAVDYRPDGTTTWRNALPLLRLNGESVDSGDYITPNQFAGCVLDLQPDTSYEVRFTMTDPDGGGTTQTVTTSTRPVPIANITGTTRHVFPATHTDPLGTNEYIGLQDAYDDAQPGDLILVHAGTYTESSLTDYTLADKGATATSPVVIRGAGDGEAIFDAGGGSGLAVLFDAKHAHHHYLEHLTLRGADRLIVAGIGNDGVTGLVIRGCFITDTTEAVHALSGNCKDLYIVDNVFIGPNTNFPQNIKDGSHGVWLKGTGHVVCYNRFEDWEDAIGFGSSSAPDQRTHANASADFAYNIISNMADDAIELDYSDRNVRAYRNFIYNVFNSISCQPVWGGPNYIYRNVIYNVTRGSFKFNREPSGLLVFHNTVIGNAGFDMTFGWSNSQFQNNLFIGRDGAPNEFIWSGTKTPNQLALDHNGYRDNSSTNNLFFWSTPTHTYTLSSFADFVSSTGWGTDAVILDYVIFVNASAPTSDDMPLPSDLDLRLKATSTAAGAGIVVPQISGTFPGAQPSLGALELEQPEPMYGPRMECRNEPGTSASFNGTTSYVDVGVIPGFPVAGDDFSIGTAVKPASYGDYQVYFEQRGTNSMGGISVWLRSDGAIRFESRGNVELAVTTTNGFYTAGAWNFLHVVVSDNGADREVRFYINGILTDTVTTSGEIYTMNHRAFIGVRDVINSTDRHFNGEIDEVYLVNRALTEDEIRDQVNGGIGAYGRPELDLVALWHLDELVSGDTPDSSGWNYDGVTYQVSLVDSHIALEPRCGLVGQWALDESTGTTAADATFAGHDGTLEGGLSFTSDSVTGLMGGALSFDGVNDMIRVANPSDGSLDFGTGTFTLSAWIKTTASSNYGYILAKYSSGGAHYYLQRNSGYITAQVSDGVTNMYCAAWIGATVYDGNWHHVAVTLDTTSTLTVYFDGVATYSVTNTSLGDITNNNPVTIGNRNTPYSDYFEGTIDDLRIYDYALSSDQIARVANP